MKNNSTTTVVLVVIIGSIICFLIGICVACGMFTLVTVPFDNFYNNSDSAEEYEGSGSAPEIGETAPDFQLDSLSGGSVTLSEHRGRPALVNFWATWCGPCVEEMPVIESRFREHYPELVVLAIESDSSRNDLLDFVQEEEITFTVLIGTGNIERDYEIYAYPTSFFIDANGVVQSVVVGSMTENSLDTELAKIGVGD
jgi:thiol-disulfide isomerase/thioredoxin